jgi:hypothetical protein
MKTINSKTGKRILNIALLGILGLFSEIALNSHFFISQTLAGQGQGSSQGVKGGNGGHKGQQGGSADKGTGKSGVKGKVLQGDAAESEEDSDRPEWAKGNRAANPHAQGGGQPAGAGSKKGDLYGDLWVVLRDPITGLPILDANGNVQPIIKLADGTTQVIQLTSEGDVPEEYLPYIQEVEFSRLSVGRSPSKVISHSLDEVTSKILNGTSITLDASGRLVIDGATVDSPLENLALYVALLTNSPDLSDEVKTKLEALPGDILTLAASLLAGAADKTGKIGIDLVAYENLVLGVSKPTAYYDYSTFDYDRSTTYSSEITYYVLKADGTIVSETKTIYDAVFNSVPYSATDGGITAFAQATDDALQVIEFVHTQIHTE